MIKNHQEALFTTMQQASFYPHAVISIQRIDTHISTLFLTGELVYKLKKSVNFGFLNFSTLEQRKTFCEEELRLNRRTAPDLYLDAIAIYCSKQGEYGFDGTPEEIIEYAVKMRQFDPQQQLDLLLNRNEIQLEQINELARQIAQFHSHAEIAEKHSTWGSPNALLKPCQENSEAIRNYLNNAELIESLDGWMAIQWNKHTPLFKQRKANGQIRECHGDMHLANIAVIDGKITFYSRCRFIKKLI